MKVWQLYLDWDDPHVRKLFGCDHDDAADRLVATEEAAREIAAEQALRNVTELTGKVASSWNKQYKAEAAAWRDTRYSTCEEIGQVTAGLVLAAVAP